jgi:hypothetical protein
VRIPLKDGKLPKHANIKADVALDHGKSASKSKEPVKPKAVKPTVAAEKSGETDKHRLERLEKMLKKLEEEMRALKQKPDKPKEEL